MATTPDHIDWAMDELKKGGDVEHAKVHAELAKAAAVAQLAWVLEQFVTLMAEEV